MATKAGVFSSQRQLRGAAMDGSAVRSPTNYGDDNLFAGVWRLNQENLNRFDSYLSGYAFICWVKGCRFMEDGAGVQNWSNFKFLTERNFKAFSGINNLSLDTDAMTMGFTGNELPVAQNLKKDITTFGLTHYELAGSPVRELYQYWITGIRDPETGLAHYHGLINTSDAWLYSIKNHSAEIVYIVTDPSGARHLVPNSDTFASRSGGDNTKYGIEFCCMFTNAFPTQIPQEHLNYTSGDHSLAEIAIDFRGCYHQSFQINNLGIEIMKEYSIKRMYGDYIAANRTKAADTYQRGYDEKNEA